MTSLRFHERLCALPLTALASALLLSSACALPCRALDGIASNGTASDGIASDGTASAAQAEERTPLELFEVVKIVDGDTIHIMRAGEKEKLRLLSVDTEEKINPNMRSSASKPQTVFGEETKLWTIDYMGQFRDEAGKLSIGLSFPGGAEAHDVYGRLLCHVVMPDGTDFNLLLVELGKSPYFNKYGNSLICHEKFVAAQERARRYRLGIWDPNTNQPLGEDTPIAGRDYERLLPWWQARADAIDSLRERLARGETGVLHAEDSAALAEATARGATVEVFGTPDRFFEEDDGSLTVLFRAGSKRTALRVSIPAEARTAFEQLELESLKREFRQNYVYVRGTLSQGPRGPQMTTAAPQAWRRAGPEPAQ